MNNELTNSNPEDKVNPKLTFHYDLEILDRFQKFSEEILRISILTIGAIGYLLGMDGFKQNLISLKNYIIIGLILLGLSSVLSLLHRYYSTDSMTNHLLFLRKGLLYSKTTRDKEFKLSAKLIFFSVLSLALGVLCIIFSLIYYFDSNLK